MIHRLGGLAGCGLASRIRAAPLIARFKRISILRAPLPHRILVVAVVLFASFTLSSHLGRTAYAIVTGCRGDPIVRLSNGQQIQMTVEVAADASDVQEVRYTVHAPVGTSITRVIYTGGPLASKERVVFYDDLPSHHYSTETLVYLLGKETQVSAKTAMRNRIERVSGLTGEPLVVKIRLDR